MIKVNGTTVEYEGKGSDLVAECALAVAGTANAIANGDSNSAEAALYSVLFFTTMLVCMVLATKE